MTNFTLRRSYAVVDQSNELSVFHGVDLDLQFKFKFE